jgi:hypothetical protein
MARAAFIPSLRVPGVRSVPRTVDLRLPYCHADSLGRLFQAVAGVPQPACNSQACLISPSKFGHLIARRSAAYKKDDDVGPSKRGRPNE